jgi:two-component system chemotaxis response regulator CheB
MAEMHTTGSFTIAQDEASCVVYGMPREAVALGGVDKVLSLKEIPPAIMHYGGDLDGRR